MSLLFEHDFRVVLTSHYIDPSSDLLLLCTAFLYPLCYLCASVSPSTSDRRISVAVGFEIASRHAASMPRSKASFTPQEFADAMDSLVASKGKSFCTYSNESGQVAKAVLDKSSLQENHDVLGVMRGLAGNWP